MKRIKIVKCFRDWIAIGSLGGLTMGMAAHGQGIEIDLASSPISLRPNEANQRVVVMARNTTGGSLGVLMANLSFQIADGVDTSSAPSITAVDVSTGTPWATLFGSDYVSVTISQPTAQFYNVSFGIKVDAPEGTAASLPEGLFRLAEITFDTTSLAGGPWGFSMTGVNETYGTDTEFTLSGLNAANTLATVGTLTTVPEVREMTVISGLAVLGWLGWHRSRVRRV